jgi:hypothetical protein
MQGTARFQGHAGHGHWSRQAFIFSKDAANLLVVRPTPHQRNETGPESFMCASTLIRQNTRARVRSTQASGFASSQIRRSQDHLSRSHIVLSSLWLLTIATTDVAAQKNKLRRVAVDTVVGSAEGGCTVTLDDGVANCCSPQRLMPSVREI